MSETPHDYLERLGRGGEGPHDIARAALMLAALDHPGTPLEPSLAHLNELAQTMEAQSGAIQRVGDAAQALSGLLAGQFGYDGERLRYEEPQNADLIAVIARRRGLPVTLGILYIHAARAAGLTASGLDTPGHFLVRIGHRHDDATIDPFNGGVMLVPGHIPDALGDVLLAQPVGDTDVLLRLQNNLKLRAQENGQLQRALDVAHRMLLIAPRRADLWFEVGKLNEAVGVLGAARSAYEKCLSLVPPGQALHNEAVLSLAQLKRRLN